MFLDPVPVRRIDPWIITCESWFAEGKYIALPINPEQIEFSSGLRVAHDEGYNAKFIYIWRRRRNQSMNSSMTINFSLSSGNIVPQFNLTNPQKYDLATKYSGNVPPSLDMAADHRKGTAEYCQASVNGIYDMAVPIGVSNLYALLALADEYRIREVGRTDDGIQQTSNRIIVCLSTMIFPRLLLYGWFTPDGISFTMNADNPGEFTVNFSMLVTGSNPTLNFDGWQGLVESYRQNMYNPTRTVDWASAQMGLNTKLSGTHDNEPMPNAPKISGDPVGASDLMRPHAANDDQTG